MTETSYCRLCAELISTETSIALIDSVECKQNLIYKIFECFHLQIQLSDHLPKFICSECYKQVLNTFEFSEKIRRGQGVLSGLFSQLDDKNIKVEWNESVGHMNEEEYKVFIKSEPNDNDDEDFDYTAGNFCTVKNESFSDEECGTTTDTSPTEGACNTLPKEGESKKTAGNLNSIVKTKKELQKAKKREARKIFLEWRNYEWICNVCDNKFPSVQALRDHYEQIHNAPVQYTCMECSKVVITYDGFRKHVRRHWNKNRYQCDVCGKYFADKTARKGHMVVHSEERKFMCSTCGESFKTEKTLSTHMRIHFPDDQKAECDMCHKTFSTPLYLTKHKKRHEGLRPCTCEQCGMTFAQKNGLDKHIICAHTDQAPVPCPHCPKILKNILSFRRHEREHTDIKHYECLPCGKKFRLNSQLKEHSRIHSRDLPFECEHCKKCFRTKANLKIHLRQHTGERPFSCLECNHDFVDTSNFLKHLRKRHGFDKTSLVNQRQYPFRNSEPENVFGQPLFGMF